MGKKVLMNCAFCFVWSEMDGKLKITFLKNKNKALSKFSLWTVWFPRKLRKNRGKMKLMNLDSLSFLLWFSKNEKVFFKRVISCVELCLMESEFQMVEASNIFVSKFLYIFTATNQRILCCLDSEEMKERKEKKW